MKKKHVFLIVASVILIVILGMVFLYIYGFFISRPSYNAEYFIPEYLVKYSSPEITWEHHINARMSDDVEYYQEVLGRKLTEKEQKYLKEHPYNGWEKPKILNAEISEDIAYIVSDNNWGTFLEKVNGRWVFTPEDWGSNIRAFFEIFK